MERFSLLVGLWYLAIMFDVSALSSSTMPWSQTIRNRRSRPAIHPPRHTTACMRFIYKREWNKYYENHRGSSAREKNKTTKKNKTILQLSKGRHRGIASRYRRHFLGGRGRLSLIMLITFLELYVCCSGNNRDYGAIHKKKYVSFKEHSAVTHEVSDT